MTEEKKGITVKINAELHAEVRQYLEEHEMTMGEFVSLALQNELNPKLNVQEEKTMGNMRTMAFQVPEELFQKIKDYLQRNNMTQKQFVIGLIENEIWRREQRKRSSARQLPRERLRAVPATKARIWTMSKTSPKIRECRWECELSHHIEIRTAKFGFRQNWKLSAVFYLVKTDKV